MTLGKLNDRSLHPGTELGYVDGLFNLSTGEQLGVAEVVRLDHDEAIDWADEATRDWVYANQERFLQPSIAVPAQPLDSDQRAQLLAQAIQTQVVTGARVESQGSHNAVVVRGKRVNHLLHLLLTLLTAGLWAIVWIVMALGGGEKRTTVSVDAYGNVLVQRV